MTTSPQSRRDDAGACASTRHVRVVERLVIHPTPLSFEQLCRRAVPRDARYVVLDLDKTCFDGSNIGELLGFELIAREAYGDAYLDGLVGTRAPKRFLWAWRRPITLVRYLATGVRQWSGPGLHYFLRLKRASRREARLRRTFRRYGPSPVEVIQRVPQMTLFHQLAGVPLPRLRELATRILRRHGRHQVIDADDIAWLRGWCPGATVVIASASPQPVVEAAVAHLGADVALYSEIEARDGRPSAPPSFPTSVTRRRLPERFAPLDTLRINGGPRKVAALEERFPDIFAPGVVSVGISDTSYGEDHCWADHFTHVIDVNSPSPFSPLVAAGSPVQSIHSARLVPAETAAPAAPVTLSRDALTSALAGSLTALDALEAASQRWRDEPSDERAALERASSEHQARLAEAVAAYNDSAPGSPDRSRRLREVQRAARAVARHEARLAAAARPQAMRAFAIHALRKRARARLTATRPGPTPVAGRLAPPRAGRSS